MRPVSRNRDVRPARQGATPIYCLEMNPSIPRNNLTLGLLLAFSALNLTSLQTAHAGTEHSRYVATLEQTLNEDKQQFILRVGGFLAERQERTTHEACGSICSAPNGSLAVMVFTSDRTNSCPVMLGCPLSHPTITEDFIHSHPAFPPFGTFSGHDYEIGPGYLVRGSRMYYQNGRGTARRLAPPAEGHAEAADRRIVGP